MNRSPSRSSTHGVTGSIGCASASARISSNDRVLRETFERPPRREDQPRFAALVALQNLGGGDPGRAGAFAFDDPRLPFARRRCGDEEQGVEPAHRVELRNPARERGERAELQLKALCAEQRRRSGWSATSASLKFAAPSRHRGAARARPEPPSPRPFRGSPPRRRVDAQLGSEPAVRFVDAAAWKNQRAGGESHAPRALDHQQLGRPARHARGQRSA